MILDYLVKVFVGGIAMFLLIEAIWYYLIIFLNNKHIETKKLIIKYHHSAGRLKEIKGSDWQDCQACENVSMKSGELKYISLGFSLKLPDGYEAHLAPRSSTYKNWGIIQANSVGVVDESYCGNEDIWKFPAVALRDTNIEVGDRIAQFRIVKKQPKLIFDEVEFLHGKNRDGFGSTGKNKF